MLDARPKVAELSFQLYGRSLHPELFEVFQSRTIDRGPFSAQIHITSAGHVIAWKWNNQTMTEVAASAQHPLPRQQRLLCHPLRGECTDELQCRNGVRYWMRFQLEPVSTELFWAVQKELASGAKIDGLVHQFGSSGRMAMGAVSYINVETRRRSMYVQAFHTFPDDYAIVKCESRFEVPEEA
ncbi:MAG TPA: DUF2617 family protein [Planctomycetaceae bacterium]|nr:DUF2617 family protein [Planctomycetaceae bacterium]